MLLQILIMSFLGSVQAMESSAADQTIEFYDIIRVNAPSYKAQVSYSPGQSIDVGQQLSIDTPDGTCQVEVTEIYSTHFYINTRHCSISNVRVGTQVSSKLKVFRRVAAETSDPYEDNFDDSNDSFKLTFMDRWSKTDFYQNYISDKLSTYISYHLSNTLEGDAPVANDATLSELSGSNTIGFGAEYRLVKLPQRLSLSAGLTYELPRSFGEYVLTTSNGNQQSNNFNKNPTLYVWNFYANLRYQIMTELIAYVGVNRLVATMKNIPGEVSGDIGFHFGARYYPYQRFFVEGTMNFYNMDYAFLGNRSDLNLTELEIKGGYTF